MKNDCKCYQIRNDNFNNYTDEEDQKKTKIISDNNTYFQG